MKMIDKMKFNTKAKAQKKSKGAELVEYATLIAVVATAAVAFFAQVNNGLQALGTKINTYLQSVSVS